MTLLRLLRRPGANLALLVAILPILAPVWAFASFGPAAPAEAICAYRSADAGTPVPATPSLPHQHVCPLCAVCDESLGFMPPDGPTLRLPNHPFAIYRGVGQAKMVRETVAVANRARAPPSLS